MLRKILPIAACTLLAGCNMYTVPGTSPSALDGSYSGTMSALHAAANSCASTAPVSSKLTVANGAVTWPASASLTLYAPVMQDGAFTAQNGTVFLSGKITNKAMVARVSTGTCHYIYDLSKT
ncbi:hypothetical protein [Acidisphaera sp. L21]|jgi:hypothetical protein|uniref:hypothetical protein n=1 Tax=Acidisphaera sp. L21 TaxID=1641851 RepID=UPI00131AA561|nr:hypothetical protein [Acidisphaera sp. L21]